MIPEQVIRTRNNSTFLRVADRTKELKGEDLRNLEYSKNVRHYEDECHPDARIEDLDSELLASYREKLHAEALSYEEILKALRELSMQLPTENMQWQVVTSK